MALACRALIVAALLAGAVRPVEGATLGVAWDPSPDQAVTGYRVYVGTAPGQHSVSFDVSRVQTTFNYTTAQAGLRYYFAVASLAQGVAGVKSIEVSAVAGGVIAPPPAGAPSSPVAPPPSGMPTDNWLNYRSDRRPLENVNVPNSPVVTVASGLAEITAVIVLPTGGGLLVEAGARVRAFSDQGVADRVALEVPDGTRIAALVADPRFEATGFVFAAEARQTSSGDEEVFVVRHRLLGGVFGESAAVVVGQRQPVGALTRVAITAAGDVVLVQGDGRALAWDDVRGGLWRVGLDAASAVDLSFVSARDNAGAGLKYTIQPIDGGAVSEASVAVLNGVAELALASPTTVFRYVVGAGQLSNGTSVAEAGTVAALVSASTNVDYVVVRVSAAGGGDAPSFALLRVQHTDLP